MDFKKEATKMMKKLVAGLLALSLILVAVPGKAEAKGTSVAAPTAVTYVANEDLAEADRIDAVFGVKAPTKEGYLFGGWYADAEGVTPIKDADDKAAASAVYAKFVPAQILSVKSQNHSTTVVGGNATSTRLVSSVDSYEYANVGFDVVDMSQATDRVITDAPLDVVYSSLIATTASGSKRLTPEAVYGEIEGAVAQKFIVLSLNDIPESYWGADIYVRPYWTTFDGVKVSGLAKYVYVEDGINGWVSVPVNLHTGVGVTAGMVSISIPEGLEYQGFRNGKVFDEVQAVANGGVVKFVGNTTEVVNVAAQDMLAVFRFKVNSEWRVGSGTQLDFTVSDLGFANTAETYVDMNLLNVKY